MRNRRHAGLTELYVLAGAILLVLLAVIYGQHERLSTAASLHEVDVAEIDRLKASARLADEARAEGERRVQDQSKVANNAQRQLELARGDLNNARGMLSRYVAALARARKAPADTAPAVGGTATAGADMVPADVYSALITGARRVGDRAIDLADLADRRGIAGAACEQAYDTLRR